MVRATHAQQQQNEVPTFAGSDSILGLTYYQI
jgi:hypothetical protein